jgi:alpha-ribazole phosphatase/probable phosphoglycerate mutase
MLLEEDTMSVKITYFVHGTTIDNLENRSTGWLNGELTPKGINQSILLKDQINMNDFDIVFCSDLKRAIDSAELTFKGIKNIIQDKRLRECNYGDLNGKNEGLVNYEEHIDIPFPNGECLLDVQKRMNNFITFLLKNYDGKHIAIVAHKAPQLALEVITNDKTWEQAIIDDWRKTKAWQPGWDYTINKIKR